MSNKRTKKPSNAVSKSVAVGTPLSILLGWGAATIAAKNPGIPVEVIGSGIALLGQGVSQLVAWFARGGRKGEAD